MRSVYRVGDVEHLGDRRQRQRLEPDLVHLQHDDPEQAAEFDEFLDVRTFDTGAEFDGDRVTVRNVRNFAYRSETDYTPAYYDKTYDLARLRSVDLVAVYWMGPAIAHTFLSFGFEGGDHLLRERGFGFRVQRHDGRVLDDQAHGRARTDGLVLGQEPDPGRARGPSFDRGEVALRTADQRIEPAEQMQQRALA